MLALIALGLLGMLDALRPSRLWQAAQTLWQAAQARLPRWALRHRSWQPYDTQQALQRGWQRFLRRLRAHQLHIAASEGAASFGQRAAQALPQDAAAIDRIVQSYLQLRYGAPADSATQQRELQTWEALVARFRPGFGSEFRS